MCKHRLLPCIVVGIGGSHARDPHSPGAGLGELSVTVECVGVACVPGRVALDGWESFS